MSYDADIDSRCGVPPATFPALFEVMTETSRLKLVIFGDHHKGFWPRSMGLDRNNS